MLALACVNLSSLRSAPALSGAIRGHVFLSDTEKQGQIITLSHLLTAFLTKNITGHCPRNKISPKISRFPNSGPGAGTSGQASSLWPGKLKNKQFDILLNNLNKKIPGGGSVLQAPCPQEHKHRGWADVQETGQGPQEGPLHPARGGHGVRGVSPVLKCAFIHVLRGLFLWYC